VNNVVYYSVDRDENDRWYVLNENMFPISRAFDSKAEADLELERIQDT